MHILPKGWSGRNLEGVRLSVDLSFCESFFWIVATIFTLEVLLLILNLKNLPLVVEVR